jgi:hypothetical protein
MALMLRWNPPWNPACKPARWLILAAPLLPVAALPSALGGQAAAPERPVSAQLEFSGRPLAQPRPLSSAAMGLPETGAAGARGTPSRPGEALHDPRADALHALPAPDVMTVAPPRMEGEP